jgi:outer membrane usher protein
MSKRRCKRLLDRQPSFLVTLSALFLSLLLLAGAATQLAAKPRSEGSGGAACGSIVRIGSGCGASGVRIISGSAAAPREAGSFITVPDFRSKGGNRKRRAARSRGPKAGHDVTIMTGSPSSSSASPRIIVLDESVQASRRRGAPKLASQKQARGREVASSDPAVRSNRAGKRMAALAKAPLKAHARLAGVNPPHTKPAKPAAPERKQLAVKDAVKAKAPARKAASVMEDDADLVVTGSLAAPPVEASELPEEQSSADIPLVGMPVLAPAPDPIPSASVPQPAPPSPQPDAPPEPAQEEPAAELSAVDIPLASPVPGVTAPVADALSLPPAANAAATACAATPATQSAGAATAPAAAAMLPASGEFENAGDIPPPALATVPPGRSSPSEVENAADIPAPAAIMSAAPPASDKDDFSESSEVPAPLLHTAAVPAAPHDPCAPSSGQGLQLAVHINNEDSGYVASFTRRPDGTLAATAEELRLLGIKTSETNPDALVAFNEVAGISYRYDETTQTIYFQLGDEQRIAKDYSFDGRVINDDFKPPEATANWGGLLNYTLYGSLAKDFEESGMEFSGVSALLEARIFSPYGTLTNSGVATFGARDRDPQDFLRLGTTYSVSSQDYAVTMNAGDAINGGLAWTRPIRFGGLQVQRNFAIRPDLVTAPLPSVSGSAAVPSTVDIYLNNSKLYSREVGSGPFRITNLPIISGGLARVVVTDSSGRRVESAQPITSSPRLLNAGTVDFSVDAGYPRLNFGSESFDYSRHLMGSGSARYGLTNNLTIEAHAEGGAGLWNGGAGALLQAGTFGLLSAAGTISKYDDHTGAQIFGGFEGNLGPINFSIASQRSFGEYADLGLVTSKVLSGSSLLFKKPDKLSMPTADMFRSSAAPPKALDRLTVSAPVPVIDGYLSLAYVRQRAADGKKSDLVTSTYSRPIFKTGSFYLSGFADLQDKSNLGIFAGVSFQLGADTYVSTGASTTGKDFDVSTEVVRPPSTEETSWGWRLRDREGSSGGNRAAAVQGRTKYGEAEASIEQAGNGVAGSATVTGSVVVADGSVFAANRIDDSFAVVDAGAPDVDVLFENRPVGKTGSNGKLLVTKLRSHEKNRLDIKADSLPADVLVETTNQEVVPRDRVGVTVRFGVQKGVKSGIIVLHDKAGQPLPVGSKVGIGGAKPSEVVGYDGQVFIKNLQPDNTLSVKLQNSECNATFTFKDDGSPQPMIGPIICE